MYLAPGLRDVPSSQIAILDWSHAVRRRGWLVYKIDGQTVNEPDSSDIRLQARLPAGVHTVSFGGPSYLFDTSATMHFDPGHLYQVEITSTGGAGGLLLGVYLSILDTTTNRLVYAEPLVKKSQIDHPAAYR